MRLGIIARAEDRGLGIQTWEAVRHLHPERVLVVDVDNPEGWELHLDRFPGATVARLSSAGFLAEGLVREWLAGLDVVLSCETLYDWRLAEWARDAGCATVVQLNPEFFQHHLVDLPAPTVWWNPTSWRADRLPAEVRHVPVPVALDRWCDIGGRTSTPDVTPSALRVLHVVGRPAYGDRNGTELLAKALRRTSGLQVTLTSQRPTVHGAAVVGNVPDYWRLYDDQDVLVMPRRYGGLCLPVQEAMAAGLAVVMPSCPPNQDWPIVPVRWQYRGELPVPAGTVPMAETDARDLAAVLTGLAADPLLLYAAQSASLAWAASHSWEALLPLYEEELARAAGAVASRA